MRNLSIFLLSFSLVLVCSPRQETASSQQPFVTERAAAGTDKRRGESQTPTAALAPVTASHLGALQAIHKESQHNNKATDVTVAFNINPSILGGGGNKISAR